MIPNHRKKPLTLRHVALQPTLPLPRLAHTSRYLWTRTAASPFAKTSGEEREKMPCLILSTNVSLDGVDTSAIFSEATKAVAKFIGKPEAVGSGP